MSTIQIEISARILNFDNKIRMNEKLFRYLHIAFWLYKKNT